MTTRRLLMAAAMAGLAVSIYSQAAWYGLWLGSVVAGLALALAIDCGIFAAMRAAFDGDDRALWVVGGLALVSWLANAQHAAMIHAGNALALEGWAALDPLTGINAIMTAGIAPVAAVALAWLGHRAGKREAAAVPDTAALTAALYAPLPAWDDAPLRFPQPDPPPPTVTAPKPAPKARKAAPAAPAVLAAKKTVQATGKLPDGFSTQAALAKHLGIDPARVSEWKREIASANGAGASGAAGTGVG